MDSKILENFIEDSFTKDALPSLMDYIRIPNLSPSYDPDWNKNGYLENAAKHLYDWVSTQNVSGLKAEIVKDSDKTPLLFIEIAPSAVQDKKSILMYGHFDKQPPFTGWKDGYGPTIPIIDGDLLYGRGSADDGYSTYAAVLCIKAIQQQKLSHPKIVIVIEGSEESGSIDLPSYIIKLSDRIGKPDAIICLDSVISDYKRIWMTNSLRGIFVFDLTVKCLTRGIHSGLGTGIAPESFMILRKIIGKIENNDGQLKDCEVEIPQDVLIAAKKTRDAIGDTIVTKVPTLPGVKLISQDPLELILNNTWRPCLAVVGASGLPNLNIAGNVLRPETKVRLSIRLPPIKNSNEAMTTILTKIKENPPFNCSVIIENASALDGWKCPVQNDKLKEKISFVSKTYFNEDFCEAGVGGSIPFMKMLNVLFPESQFIVTGAKGLDSNAHGPNENINLPYLKKFMCSISHLVSEYKNFI